VQKRAYVRTAFLGEFITFTDRPSFTTFKIDFLIYKIDFAIAGSLMLRNAALLPVVQPAQAAVQLELAKIGAMLQLHFGGGVSCTRLASRLAGL